MASISDLVKDYIKEYMTEMFYLEGKDKDYYFGISKLNDELTVFYGKEQFSGKCRRFYRYDQQSTASGVYETLLHSLLRRQNWKQSKNKGHQQTHKFGLN